MNSTEYFAADTAVTVRYKKCAQDPLTVLLFGVKWT